MNNIKNITEDLTKIYGNFIYPTNDPEAYQQYTKYNQVYNKLIIAQYQKLDSGPYPIKPKKYPIVSKPIINLFGMGMNSRKINNVNEFNAEHNTGNFWCEFIKGDHLSWDLIVRNGKILYHTCFYGKKKKFGSFIYWEQIDKSICQNVISLLDHFLHDFTGCVNMETLDNKVIEVHLRMGDISLTDKDIVKLALLNLIEPNYDIVKRQITLVNSKKINYIKLVPIWEKINDSNISILEKKYDIIKKNIVPIIENDNKLIDYVIDTPYHASPIGFKRWALLVTYDLEYTLKLKNKLENKIVI
jgi:hypothetical protein